MQNEAPQNSPQSTLSSLAEEAASLAAETVIPLGKGPGEEPVKPVNAKEERKLYASRQKVYPKRVNGRFRKIKWAVMICTLAIYYITPWLRWHRAGDIPDQAVLVDFQHQRFYFFFIEIWPQEFYYITGLLILAALSLFLVTSVAGRIWCGYACPQTVWTDLLIYVERFIEGDRNERIRLDKRPWTFSKLSKKVIKHAIWLLIGFATGGAWIFYFADAPTLLHQLPRGEAPFTAYFSLAFFTFSTYLMGGIAREQVCTYMCPWPRIQGAMFDEQTFLVSYHPTRGETRGPHKKGASWEGRGDCVDCNQCVAACPMGIDIRDGAQLECIQCALCIDACNAIMDKVGRPQGLISYDTEANLEALAKGQTQKVHLLRPRTLLYAAVISFVGLFMLVTLTTRDTVQLNVVRDRSPVFVTLSDGSIRNGYTLRVLNKEHQVKTFSVAVEGMPGALLVRGGNVDASVTTVTVPADFQQADKFFVILPKEQRSKLGSDGAVTMSFTLTDENGDKVAVGESTFRGPKS
ncbi:MAG: cytochrome c oxidase accessory protein CcoG [Alphaproteobacteria bacterium]|nr:MAG: cytochrome c oxidase accessory protein CcoG [Alphaproteobacteria bacterium]